MNAGTKALPRSDARPLTDTTVTQYGVDEDGYRDTFIITGDIEAMWFRDSTNQACGACPAGQEKGSGDSLRAWALTGGACRWRAGGRCGS